MTSPNPMALEAKALEAARLALWDWSEVHLAPTKDNIEITRQQAAAIVGAYLAALPLPAAGEGLEPVAVKPLDWETKAGQDWSVAETPFGEYTVTRYVETDGVCWEGVYSDAGMICQHGSEVEAKAACQADYDQRIRSALASTPAARAAVLPGNKVYLAARYSRAGELRGYRQQLLAAGFVVTSRWIDGGHELTKDGSVQAHETDRQHFAMEDYADCDAADIVISFTEEPRKTTTRGGRHVEYGVALKGGKRAIVIGHRENVFHCLPQAEFYPDFAAAIRALKEKT